MVQNLFSLSIAQLEVHKVEEFGLHLSKQLIIITIIVQLLDLELFEGL